MDCVIIKNCYCSKILVFGCLLFVVYVVYVHRGGYLFDVVVVLMLG